MQIFVKTLKGTIVSLDVDPEETIKAVKTKVIAKFAPHCARARTIPEAQQCLFYEDILLNDDNTLSHYGILKDTLIVLIQRLPVT